MSASRMPSQQAMEDYYSSYFSDYDELAVTFDEPGRLGRHIAATTSLGRPARLLDFGGGDGSIALSVLQAAGVGGEVVVVDYSRPQTVAPSDRGVLVRYESDLSSLHGQSFDLVIASAVLEHLPNPTAVLSDLLDLVSLAGYFYARTPYVVPLMRLASVARVAVDFTFPGHLHDLGQPFWDHLPAWYERAAMFDVVRSTPSLVETTLRKHFARTVVAQLVKAPWYILGSRWAFVGGWEITFQRKLQSNS